MSSKQETRNASTLNHGSESEHQPPAKKPHLLKKKKTATNPKKNLDRRSLSQLLPKTDFVLDLGSPAKKVKDKNQQENNNNQSKLDGQGSVKGSYLNLRLRARSSRLSRHRKSSSSSHRQARSRRLIAMSSSLSHKEVRSRLARQGTENRAATADEGGAAKSNEQPQRSERIKQPQPQTSEEQQTQSRGPCHTGVRSRLARYRDRAATADKGEAAKSKK